MLIDREGLLARLNELYRLSAINGLGLEPVIAMKDIKALIFRMPEVEAVPVKHGQWIPVLNGIDDDTNPAFDCSECDAMCNKKHNYCPACGAKMDLEEQDE